MGWDAIKRFLKNDVTLASAIAVGMLLFFGFLGLLATSDMSGWIISALLSGITGVAVSNARCKYVTGLTRRIEANAPIEWDVTLNGVKIGKIKDAEYAGICLEVFSDKRNHIAQALNVGKVFLRAFDYVYVAIPVCVFWVFIALAVFSPESFVNIVEEIQKGGPAVIALAAKTGVKLFGFLMVISFALHVALGLSRFGFVNCFSEAINTAVRKHCGAAGEGDVVVSQLAIAGRVPATTSRLKRVSQED